MSASCCAAVELACLDPVHDVEGVDGHRCGDAHRQHVGPVLVEQPHAGATGEQARPRSTATSPPSGVDAPSPVTTTVRRPWELSVMQAPAFAM